jgi:hypothetical protein
MNCACIGIYRKDRLDESYREILRRYQKYVIEDSCWFSIELEWHMEHTYTDHERHQLIKVFGCFPEQEILIFGPCDRIFVVAYELIKHLGGLLSVNLADERDTINSYPGIKIAVQKKKYKYPLKHEPDYWLVDHVFIRKYFAKGIEHNFERFKLAPFLPSA